MKVIWISLIRTTFAVIIVLSKCTSLILSTDLHIFEIIQLYIRNLALVIKTMKSAPWCYGEKSTVFGLDCVYFYLFIFSFFFFLILLKLYEATDFLLSVFWSVTMVLLVILGLHIKWPCGGSCCIVIKHLATTRWYICALQLVVSLRLSNYGPSICAIIYWTMFEEIRLLLFIDGSFWLTAL